MEFGTSAKIQDEHLFRLLAEYAAEGSSDWFHLEKGDWAPLSLMVAVL